MAAGLVVVAEGVRDDGGGQSEELLPDGGGDRDTGLAQACGRVVGAGRPSGPAAGEEPARCVVGGGVHVGAVRDVCQQQSCDWCGDGGGLPEPQKGGLSVVQYVVDSQLDDPG
ncbi:hypothetical protein OG379_01460 [Streptomyces sp. NBC_01166]|uniref:hypothetical protein n=1 Tax=Streptomyces sp. NBC_01166 TaxID=2903755 RepID=UPI00386D130E|nr:hypothetical protein OG379_01460 [Streptomyces sp. NBC_01166]